MIVVEGLLIMSDVEPPDGFQLLDRSTRVAAPPLPNRYNTNKIEGLYKERAAFLP
jgi:hypothetical protein